MNHPGPTTDPVPLPTVRAVVVTWNGLHLIRPCLDSLLAQDLERGLEVVVVDNASSDGTAEMLAELYPQVEVRVTEENLGFAGGVEVGLAGLSTDYAVLLNNDATFEPDAIRRLVDHLEAPGHERVGAVTAKIVLTEHDADGRTLVNSTGNVLTRAGAATDRDWSALDGSESTDVEVFGFCGGAAALRSTALAEAGGFDASLFLYYEDTDLSWRMRAAGWDIHYVARALARHQHAASSDAASPLFRYYNTRNSLLVFGRHAPLGAVILSHARQTAALLQHSLRRSEPPTLLRARLRALLDVARLLPRTARQRRTTWTGRAALRRTVYRDGLRP